MTQLPLTTRPAAQVIAALSDGPLTEWKLKGRITYSLAYALRKAREIVPIGCEVRSWKGIRYAEYHLSKDWS